MTPGVAAVLRRGADHQRAGRLAEAEACYRQVLRQDRRNAAALHLLGVALAGLGRAADAAETLKSAVRHDADNPALLNNLGNVLTTLRRYDDAVEKFERALALRPDYAEAHANLGIALKNLKRLEAALAHLDRAVALRREAAEAWCNRGSVLIALNRLDEAVQSLDRAIALRPDYAIAHANRGNALFLLEQLAEAGASYHRALALRPDSAEMLANSGMVLDDLGEHEQALARADRAIALQPDLAQAHDLRGLALSHLGRLREAGASFDRATALDPASPECARNKAHFALSVGDFAAGWRFFERRWEARSFTSPRRDFAQPQWRGEPLEGRTLLLHAEQGFGDTIQFCRYAPMAAARGGPVVLEVPRPLVRLVACLPGLAGVIATGEALPAFDLHCPLMSLPLAFGTTLATIPAPLGYLRADPALRARWGARLPPAPGPRAGLVWSGTLLRRPAYTRAIALAALLPLAGCGATLVALQKTVHDRDRPVLDATPAIAWLGPEFADFADTAAVVDQLDLVIAVDTGLAHLAAALGRPTWVLQTYAPEWRWLRDRDDSPWYPTVRLFRQQVRGDWDGVVARVAAALTAFVQAWGAGGAVAAAPARW